MTIQSLGKMTRSNWIELCGSRLAAREINNFSPLEICDVGRTAHGVELTAPPLHLLENAFKLISILQWLREAEGSASVLINSWYRDREYNEVIGGVPNSMHLTLGACDVTKKGKTPKEVADLLETHPQADLLGIGRYNSFTHVDCRGMMARPSPARWGNNN